MVTVGVLAGVLLVVAGIHRFWLRQLTHVTGDAQWIWVTDLLERVHPTAGLFAASVRLDVPPTRALLKVCGDREYVVYVNGTAAAAGWSRPGFRLEVFEIAYLLRQGENAIVAEVRSPTPAGGLLLALDVAGMGRNVLVSGPAFSLRSEFSLSATHPSDRAVPVIWGAPPRNPWGYPAPLVRPRTMEGVVVVDPLYLPAEAAEALPGGGIRFALQEKVFGYVWVHFEDDRPAFSTVRAGGNGFCLTRLRNDAQPVARVRGQKRWLDPEPRLVSDVFVFGAARVAGIEVWPVAEEFRSTAPGVVPGTFGPVPRTRWPTRTPPR